MGESPYRYMRNPWLEGNGTLCFGIPSELVKKLGLNRDSFLYVELIDNSIIAIKRVNPQFTKSDINKITSQKSHTEEKRTIVDEKDKSPKIDEEFFNPLKDLNL